MRENGKVSPSCSSEEKGFCFGEVQTIVVHCEVVAVQFDIGQAHVISHDHYSVVARSPVHSCMCFVDDDDVFVYLQTVSSGQMIEQSDFCCEVVASVLFIA